jgi:hypothetical protein
MSVCVENRPPEIAGLVAAKNGFALVEAACTPASRLIQTALLCLIAVICLTAAAAAGITAAGGFSPTGIDDLTASAEPVAPVPVPSVPGWNATITTPTVQTVVLRGQPPSRAGGHLSSAVIADPGSR